MPGRMSVLYNGFMMSNNCKIIAENPSTESRNQLCAGHYGVGGNPATVTCDSHHKCVRSTMSYTT